MTVCRRHTRGLAIGCLALMIVGCTDSGPRTNGTSSSAETGHRIAFVTNQIASFWNIAEVGCIDAGKDLDVSVDVRMPSEASAVVQKQIVEDLLAGGIDAIAISPLDADNQIGVLNQWAATVPLITHDSDAPGANRLMYIGMDNYEAGRMCGQLVKEALPDGGNVILCIGRLEQDNSKRRRQGVIDELLDRDHDPTRFDPRDQVIQGEKYVILATITDTGKQDIAKRKAEDAITKYPDLHAFVGLFVYNPPACLQAIKSQGKNGQIKLIGFDEDELTLQGIKDGDIQGTVVQDPYEYGYQSIKVLKSVLDGDNSVIPESKFIDIPARKITKDNVDEFWADLKSKLSG